MSQTLRYVDEIIASFPDNSSGIIKEVSMRDFVISYASGGAFQETTTDVNIPIVSGTPVAVTPLLTGLTQVSGFWQFDGNNFVFADYVNQLPATVVPAGYTKLGRFLAVLGLTKAGGGTDTYNVQWTKNGVLVGVVHDVDYSGSTTRTVTIPFVSPQEIDTADTYGVSITGIGTGDDLTLESFSMQISDRILDTSP